MPAIEYSFDRPFEAQAVKRLFKQAGWAQDRSLDSIERMLEATPVKLGAWRGDDLVAFARVISDDAYKAMIDDVIVDETLRGKGMGTELIRRLVNRVKHVETIFLPTDENLVSFYERLGFERSKTVYMKLKPESLR